MATLPIPLVEIGREGKRKNISFSLRHYFSRNVHDNVEVKFLGLIVDLKLT